jgi:hypothetical protein
VKDRGIWPTPPPKPTVPENARGLTAQSTFWHMDDADQARHKAGWWASYNNKPLSPTAKPAFKEGWEEGQLMLRGPRYRFKLTRKLGGDKGVVLFCMLNPSTASATKDDPTIRRCVGFAKLWGFSELRVVNLFAVRSTKPSGLREVEDPIGRGNDEFVTNEISEADLLVAAWGATGGFIKRKREFLERFGHHAWMCLGHTKAGHPKHPLYQRSDTELEFFKTARFVPECVECAGSRHCPECMDEPETFCGEPCCSKCGGS